MRWKLPKVGTVVWKKRFAFFPKKIDNTTVWLEFYYSYAIVLEHAWDNTASWFKANYLPESHKVQEYLLSISPLGKAMTEEKDEN